MLIFHNITVVDGKTKMQKFKFYSDLSNHAKD